jgi:hypothetical protein
MSIRLFFGGAGTLLIALSLGLHLEGAAMLILVLGLTLLSGIWLPLTTQRSLATVFGVIAILIGMYTIVINRDFLGISFSALDSLLFLILGAWSFLVAFRKGHPAA